MKCKFLSKKHQENAVCKDENERFNVQFELGTAAEGELESLSGKIIELDKILNELEKLVGEWDRVSMKGTVSSCINKLLEFNAAQGNEKYEKKIEILRNFGKTIDNFNETKKENISKGTKLVKIKELTDTLEIYESFESVIGTLKKRFKVIKEIYAECEGFELLINDVATKTVENKKKIQELAGLHKEVLKDINAYYEVIGDVEILDKEFNKLLV